MLLKAGTVATLDPPLVELADLRIRKHRIVERRASLEAEPAEEVIDLGGALVLPGLVNAHTHLYSALARGMPSPRSPARNFLEVLERVWWRLDRALDEESVYLSGLVGGMEAALSGTTLLIDHHSSPSFIRGSLGVLAGALEEVGVRSVLCYEVTDRNGPAGRDLGIEENVAFQKETRSPLTRGMVGGHASFTLSEESLERLAGALAATGAGLHIHVAEDACDLEDSRARYASSPTERLRRNGLLQPRTLLAHCVHLAQEELQDVQGHGCWIAHNPRSNMNNAVGHAHAEALHRASLGTDGIDEDILAEARAAFLKMREAGSSEAMAIAVRLLAGGHRLGAALFGLPFGKLDAGAPADLLVLDYPPPTPLNAQNLAGHLLFGVDRSHVESVMVAGEWVVRHRRLTRVKPEDILPRARLAAEALWRRMTVSSEVPSPPPGKAR